MPKDGRIEVHTAPVQRTTIQLREVVGIGAEPWRDYFPWVSEGPHHESDVFAEQVVCVQFVVAGRLDIELDCCADDIRKRFIERPWLVGRPRVPEARGKERDAVRHFVGDDVDRGERAVQKERFAKDHESSGIRVAW